MIPNRSRRIFPATVGGAASTMLQTASALYASSNNAVFQCITSPPGVGD